MSRHLSKSIAAVLALAGCTTAPPAQYVHVAEVAASADVDHEAYRFTIVPAHSFLKDAPWRVYREKQEPRNTVLIGGLPGHSYTLSVRFKGKDADAERLARIAETHHQGMRFLPSPHNALCVASEHAHAGQPAAPAKTVFAACLNPGTSEVFELALSERSIVADEAATELAEAMRAILGSFKFK